MAKKRSGGSADAPRARHAAEQTDPRFARLHTDPRFLRPKAHEAKAVLDERFASLLDGSAPKKAAARPRQRQVDQYGRPRVEAQDASEMRRLYRLAGEGEGEQSQDSDDSASSSESEAPQGDIDYARGEGLLESSGGESSDEEGDREDARSEASDDASSADDYDGVLLGRADVRRREKKRQAREGTPSSGSEDGSVAAAEAEASEDLDEAALAELDAQAAANLRAANTAGPSSSKGASAVPRADAQVLRGDATARLAMVNLDWDHVRAVDLLVMLSSLVSPSATRLPGHAAAERHSASSAVKGHVHSVRIYPSEFGRERMERENREGPPREIFKRDDAAPGSSKKRSKSRSKKRSGAEDEEEAEDVFEVDEGGEFDEEMLRRYQLERLRYYYAIATFDSAATAQHVYDELDGTEMERTANVFDLRFVPDEMDFPATQGGEEGWRDEAREGEEVGTYRGVDFRTDALRHSKVKLTWDADDSARQKVTRAVNRDLSKSQLRDDDFRAYLASASEDEAEQPDDEQEAARFRALMGLDGTDGPAAGKRKGRSAAFEDAREAPEEGDMQITFLPGLSEAAARKASGKAQSTGDETTIEKYRRKQKEKKQQKEKKLKRAKDAPAEADEASEGVQEGASAGPSAAGFDDPFFAGGDDDEDFAAALDAELGERPAKKERQKKKKDKKEQAQTPEEQAEAARAQAELELMVDSDSDGGRGHFDMKEILRTERGADKKRGARGKKLRKERDAPTQVQDGFSLDVADSRFAPVFEDHRFALDPSHPSFIKTKNMDKLLAERRRRQDASAAPAEPSSATSADAGSSGRSELAALVKSVKKRGPAGRGGRGDFAKRQKPAA